MSPHSSLVLNERGIQPFSRRNYLAACIDVGFFMGGLAFISPDIVMPALLDHLGTPEWLIRLVPMMFLLGSTLPGLFLVHLIERLRRYKPILASIGVFQRAPYAIGALLLFLAPNSPFTPYWIALSFLISATIGGLGSSAYLSMIVKVIPEKRRASYTALAFMINAAMGIFASFAISWILDASEGLQGYAWLHLITAVLVYISLGCLLTIREAPGPIPERQDQPSLTENLSSIPGLLRENPVLIRFMITRMLAMGIFLVTPLLSRHILTILGEEDVYLGHLVRMQMIGVIGGNALAAFLGDRFGGKLLIMLGMVGLLLALALAAFSTHSIAFDAMYILYGAGFSVRMVGFSTLSMELVPQRRRATILAVLAACTVPASAMVMLLGWLYALAPEHWQLPLAIIIASALSLLATLILLPLHEPRKTLNDNPAAS